jgi:hypothetical protein
MEESMQRPALRSVIVACCLAVGGLAVSASAATASAVYLCVSKTAGGAVKSGGSSAGSCESGYNQVALPEEESEQKKLLEILPYLKYEEKGIDSKPTIKFSGANVQIVSGAGEESKLNGEGNLVIGYDETPGEQSGSNNLALGKEQKYTSYGDILGGARNSALKPFVTLFGYRNTANGTYSSITGGSENKTELEWTSVSGGFGNLACSPYASVSGGMENEACSEAGFVGGGDKNKTSGVFASVTGGAKNVAGEEGASVTGGESNTANRKYTSVTGGQSNTASAAWASITGGGTNHAEGEHSAILGGKEIKLTTNYSTSP